MLKLSQNGDQFNPPCKNASFFDKNAYFSQNSTTAFLNEPIFLDEV